MQAIIWVPYHCAFCCLWIIASFWWLLDSQLLLVGVVPTDSNGDTCWRLGKFNPLCLLVFINEASRWGNNITTILPSFFLPYSGFDCASTQASLSCLFCFNCLPILPINSVLCASFNSWAHPPYFMPTRLSPLT